MLTETRKKVFVFIFMKITCPTVCVSRMYLKGTWQMRILKDENTAGDAFGAGASGWSVSGYGKAANAKPAALTGHLAEPTLGWPGTPSPNRYLRLPPKNPRPNQGSPKGV